jgi:hypothetical protein
MLARLRVGRDGVQDVAILPCRQDGAGEPAPVAPDTPEFDAYLAYLREITAQAGLNGRLSVRGGELALALPS